MTKEQRELRAQIAQLKVEARAFVSEDKIDEAKAKMKEAEALTEKADLLAQIEDDDIQSKKSSGEVKDEKEQKELYNKAFFKSFRRQKLDAAEKEVFEIRNALSETGGSPEGADGGFLVPEDVQTAINEYKRTLSPMEQFVNRVPVTTLTGSRVFETVASITALANITDDTADLDESDNPNFEQVSYSIKKYAGWLPVPNDLIKDTDQNIMAYLTRWMGKKSVVTRNTLILAKLAALSTSAFGTDYKKIKKALNVTLDPMHQAMAVIVTNQDGFQFLDTLEDGTGKPILQVDITEPSRKLFAGKPIYVMSNSVLTTSGSSTKLAPIYIGAIDEAVYMFERQGYQIDSTNVGGTAFRKDRTELRMIEREDVVSVDTDAVVHGTIDVTAAIA